LDEEDFQKFLKKGRRSPSVIMRCVTYVTEFERYLRNNRGGKQLDNANRSDLEAFSEWVKDNSRIPAKKHLWALRYYYDYASNKEMRRVAGEMRQQNIKKKPFKLRNFRGVNLEYTDRLAAAGVKNVEQMLEHGKTQARRQKLSEKTGIPAEAILEFVKLADLSRIKGVKNVRARLYYDAGIDTVEKMARWNPEELRTHLIEFVKRTGFNGIAPLPKEARYTVETAKKLPRIIEY